MAASKRQTEMILRELMQDRSGEVVDAALAARKAILKSAGECSEIIYETYCISNAFSFTGKQGQGFIHIATYANHVNIGFDRGTELEDPEGLLKGTGKLIRHIRLNTVSKCKARCNHSSDRSRRRTRTCDGREKGWGTPNTRSFLGEISQRP